jgi:flagellin
MAFGADVDGDDVPDIIVRAAAVKIGLATTTGGDESESITASALVSITTQSDAEDMLDVFDDALTYINTARSNIGAIQNRLDYAENSALNLVENISSARSQVMDTDYAQEMAEFTRLQILQAAGVSVLGQANVSLKMVLQLLDFA